MQATLYKHLKVIRYFSLKTLSMKLILFYSLFHDKDKFSIILLENIAGCQQTFRSSDSRLSPDFWSMMSLFNLKLKISRIDMLILKR